MELSILGKSLSIHILGCAKKTTMDQAANPRNKCMNYPLIGIFATKQQKIQRITPSMEEKKWLLAGWLLAFCCFTNTVQPL